MKRSALARKAQLRRKSLMARRRRAPRLVKLDDGTKAVKHDVEFGPQAELCRRLPCVVCTGRYVWEAWLADPSGSAYASDPHHEPPRASGGIDSDTLPLCREHHEIRHRIGVVSFETSYGVDLRAIAAQIAKVLHG